MENQKLPGGRASRLAWHPAFLQAIKHELFEYRDSLEFRYEYQLADDPLRIDLVIVKKLKNLAIDKNIARIFKSDNLIEYKSPDDYLSVKDFLKAYAYANFYAATASGADFSDMSLTFVESRHPRVLLKYLTKERRYQAEEISRGIYTVSGDYMPIQVIELKRLPETDNLWLNSLTKDLQASNLDAILEIANQRKAEMPLDVYLGLLSRINPETFVEVMNMATRTKKKPRRSFEEVFTEAGLIPEWKARGKAEGKIEGKAEERKYFLELLDQGLSTEEIKQRLCS